MHILTAAMSNPDSLPLTAAEAVLAIWRGELLPEDVHLGMAEVQVSVQIEKADDPR